MPKTNFQTQNPGPVTTLIFQGSSIGRKFEAGHFGSGFFLGDSVYANTPYLIVLYTDPIENY